MAATQLRLRRGTSGQHNNFSGAAGEITVVTDDWSLRVHDGVTAGGHPISGGGGGGSLSGLSDVDVTTSAPSDGDVLVYSSASGKWEPGAGGGGGGGGGASYSVSRFLSSGVWNKPANLQFVKIVAVTPGNGGDSGGGYSPWGTSYYYWPGGKGGFPGISGEWTFPASDVPDSVTVTIGAPGVGRAYDSASNLTKPGTRGGSVSFGDLVYLPVGAFQGGLAWDDNQNFTYPSDTWARDTVFDGYVEPDTNYEYPGSGASAMSWSFPGQSVRGPYNGPWNATNNINGPGGGGGGASNQPPGSNTWYSNPSNFSAKYGFSTNSGYSEYIMGSNGGEGWALRKPSIPQTLIDPYQTWAQKKRSRATFGDLGGNFRGDMSGYGMSYERELESLGGAASLTAAQLTALQMKWWGNGGGGGGIGYENGNYIPRSGANGSFPGGGGGGGACPLYGEYNGGGGGNGAGGVIYVYSFIGSSPFAYA